MAQDLGLRACAVAPPMTGLVVVWGPWCWVAPWARLDPGGCAPPGHGGRCL